MSHNQFGWMDGWMDGGALSWMPPGHWWKLKTNSLLNIKGVLELKHPFIPFKMTHFIRWLINITCIIMDRWGLLPPTYEHFCVIFYSLIWVLEVLLSSDHHQSHLGNEQKNLQKKVTQMRTQPKKLVILGRLWIPNPKKTPNKWPLSPVPSLDYPPSFFLNWRDDHGKVLPWRRRRWRRRRRWSQFCGPPAITIGLRYVGPFFFAYTRLTKQIDEF